MKCLLLSSTKSRGRGGVGLGLKPTRSAELLRTSQSAACAWSPSCPYFSKFSSANLCLRTKGSAELPSFPWCVGPPVHVSLEGSRPCLSRLSLRKQASGFMFLLSKILGGLWALGKGAQGALATCSKTLGQHAQDLYSRS